MYLNLRSGFFINSIEVEGWHTYFVGWLRVLVHNVCVKEVILESGKIAYDILLSFKSGWSDAQRMEAVQKCKNLSEMQGKSIVKKPPRLPDTRGRFKKSGKNVENGQDVDHTIDLQLGGIDDVSNMKALDQSVNRSLGSQIQHGIKKFRRRH